MARVTKPATRGANCARGLTTPFGRATS